MMLSTYGRVQSRQTPSSRKQAVEGTVDGSFEAWKASLIKLPSYVHMGNTRVGLRILGRFPRKIGSMASLESFARVVLSQQFLFLFPALFDVNSSTDLTPTA